MLSWSTTAGQHESEVQMAEFALCVFANEIRTYLQRDWMPSAVLFRHARPSGNLAMYQAAFGHDLRFNQDHNALLLDQETLDAPLSPRSSAARALASRVVRLEDDLPEKPLALSVDRKTSNSSVRDKGRSETTLTVPETRGSMMKV